MASPAAAEEHSNTKTEEGTTAFHKKRSRRVSFAENTSVHIFDRDEEFETPPDSMPPSSPSEDLGFSERDGDSKQFFGNEEEDDEDEDMDELGPRSPFLKLVGSPSSGGSTIGSATSNDEDNFFGPVSTRFIRRDLADSAASDENHDHTMDSTAFSMHFRSIARSDSEGDLKTSIGVQNSFEEKTPTPGSLPLETGNSMLMTLAKKPNSQPDVSTSKLSTGSLSNDMSLVGEYIHKYDYGKLSPTLDALLAEGSKDLHESPIKVGKQILPTKENGSDLMDFSYGQDNKLEGITSNEMLDKVVSLKHNELGVASDGSEPFPSKQIALDVSSNTSDTQASKPLSPNQSIRDSLTAKTKEPVKDAFEIKSSLDFLATSRGTPSNPKSIVYKLDDVREKENKSPLVGPITYLTDRPSHILFNGASLFKSPGTVTPIHHQASVFPRTESLKHGGSVSSLQTSISKLRILEASPFSAALNARLEDSNSRLLVSLSKMSPLGTLLESEASQAKYMNNTGTETVDPYLEEPLPSAAQKKREGAFKNMDDNRIDVVPVTRKETFVKVARPLPLPSENIRSGEDMQPNLLKSADIKHGYKDVENKIGSPQNFNCSPQKNLEVAATAEYEVSLYNGKQAIQHNEPLNFGLGHVAGSGEKTNTSLSTTVSQGTDSLYIERRENSSSLNVAVSNVEEMVHHRKEFLHGVLCNSETRGGFATLSKDKKHENLQSSVTERDIPMGGMQASLPLHGRTDEQSFQENLADQFCQGPSNKELYSVSHNDNIGSLPKENVHSNGDVNSADRKRKTEDGMTEKFARIKRSPNLRKDHVSGPELPSNIGISSIGPNLKHSVEICTRSFNETKLLPHSVDKINLHAIDRLDDILGQLQRSKTYQLLSTEIQSPKILDLGNIQHKRAAETKLLLCKILYEQAKLQLMHVKRERLLKSVQSLGFGIQESEALKLTCLPQNSLDVQVVLRQTFSDNMDIQECQVDRNKVTSIEHALNDINGRISNLTKSFHKSCKMKGEPNSEDTIALINDHLMKQAYCQIIRRDMELWVLDNLESSKDHHNIVLNYLDLMTQRLTITAGLVPSVSISNKLNEMNISKNFKDMDASNAFRFVFNAGLTHKHVGATSLANKTRMSSSLLGNLVDVMDEIQLARIELKNLIYARFHTSSDERLDLELNFFDSKSRKKATVTLNASCLKRGIYPSEIVPFHIDIPLNEPQNSSSPPLSTEISAAVQDLKIGFLRILRLCRCISLSVR